MRLSANPTSAKSKQLAFPSSAAALWTFKGAITPVAAAAIAIIAYGITISPDITWMNYGSDGGELISASVTLGIPHPPGYPTYVLLGKLFSFLPIGPTMAYRFNFFSAFAMSIAVGFLTGTILRQLSPLRGNPRAKNISAIILGLAFAFIPLVWSQAVIAEVYALNLFFIAVTLWLLIRPANKQRSVLIGIFLGLSVTAHLSSILLIPLVLSQISIKSWPRLLLGFFLGLLPFFILPLLTLTDSPVIWGNSTSLKGWWWLVSANLYQNNLQLPELFTNLTPKILIASTFLAIILIVCFILLKHRGLFANVFKIPLYSAISLTAGGYFVFAALYKTDDALLFTLPSFLLLAILLSKFAFQSGPKLMILPMILVAINLTIYQSADPLLPRSKGEEALREVPEGAILVTSGERTTFTLWYLQFVEGQREDLLLIDKDLFQFDWYRKRLGNKYPLLLNLERDDLDGFVSRNRENQDICMINIEHTIQPACSRS
ncbi:MAG: hypothetical protein BMS9Abin02_1024 [Anaerolineae bacterium]|nr:MAG: hypothetical protein BMS9Abin02_1024 [Anaerolineae bacterium]